MKEMKDKYITENERYQIEVLYRQGYKPKEIAEVIGKCLATIYNELHRGMTTLRNYDYTEYTTYCADVAQRKYEYNCTHKGRDLKLGNDYDFVEYIERKIRDEKYSPYAVLQEIKNSGMEFKTDVCKATLYNYIKQGLFMGLTMDSLPMPRKSQNKGKIERRTARNNIAGRSIENRPEEVNNREEYGHWEMDTVVSGHGKGKAALLVLTERMTREEYVIKIGGKTMEEVCRALNNLEYAMGTEKFIERFRTITCDNGCEFLDAEGIQKSINDGQRSTVYYCHPYCSSERGSNENQNKMIRRWIPKGSDISQFTDEYISQIQNWMNNYPRNLFNGMSVNQYKQKVGCA